MGFVLIFVGILVAVFGAKMFLNGYATGRQSTLGSLFTLLVQLAGLGLVIWGIVSFF